MESKRINLDVSAEELYVIGREFSYNLITAILGKPEAEVNAALDRLVQSGLVFRSGIPPNADYTFKHALVQDAAYASLLRATRRTSDPGVSSSRRKVWTARSRSPAW